MDRESIARLLKRDILRLAQVGALSGSVAGFAGLMAANGDAAQAGATVAVWTWLLLLTLPLGMVLATGIGLWQSANTPKPPPVPSRLALFRMLAVVALLGGLLGCLFEFVVASYLPTLFSGWQLDVFGVRGAIVAHYPWQATRIALILTIGVALVQTQLYYAWCVRRNHRNAGG